MMRHGGVNKKRNHKVLRPLPSDTGAVKRKEVRRRN